MSLPAFTLRRLSVRPEGAYGVLIEHRDESDIEGTPFAVTLERTYSTEAEAGISENYGSQFVKVQRGIHLCRRRYYTKGGYETYEIVQPGHTAILFHKGSQELHSEGCVLVAEAFSGAGISDGAGLIEFLQRTSGRQEFDLEVL